MERCSIIVHSVNGNSYIIATVLQELLTERGVDARLYRVEDADAHIWANKSDAANDFYEDIQALPIANESTLLKSKMVILGCPTTFGNVSAELNLAWANHPVSGIVQLAGKDNTIRPSQQLGDILAAYANTLASHMQ